MHRLQAVILLLQNVYLLNSGNNNIDVKPSLYSQSNSNEGYTVFILRKIKLFTLKFKASYPGQKVPTVLSSGLLRELTKLLKRSQKWVKPLIHMQLTILTIIFYCPREDKQCLLFVRLVVC